MPFDLNDIDWKDFKNPPKSARPMVRWWWSGLDVEKDELVREVQELDEVGFLGAEIQVFLIGCPLKMEKKKKYRDRSERSNRFMQPYYYEMVKAVLDEASKREMIIDLTIGSAWPVGGVHITKKDSLKVLLVGEKVIKGPKHFRGKVPKFKKPFFYKLLRLVKPIIGYNLAEYYRDDMRLEAVVAVKPLKKAAKIKYLRPKTSHIDKSSIIDLTDKVDVNGILQWDFPKGKWQIFAFYKGPSGVRPLLDCRPSPEDYALVLDHLSSKVIRAHLDLHIGEGKKYFGEHFGKALRAFFTDSLELSSEWLWTNDFLEQFKKRRGYDLRLYLPVCFVPNRDNKYAQALFGGKIPVADFKGGLGERIRYDFELTISDLFSEEFVRTMTIWANENKLKNRIQAYGIRADTLKTYGLAHIPETEQLYAGGMIDFLKFAGSAGIIYQKNIITAESMVWNQRDYMTTPLKWKVAADRLFISGVNQMIYHGFPYQNSLFPYPGYCGFSTPYEPKQMNFSSNFSRMNPFWEFFPIINKYITRCQFILQHGKFVNNLAIYYPVFNYCDSVLKREDLVGGYLDKNDALMARRQVDAYVKKKKKWNIEDRWTSFLINMGDILTQNGYNYTHVNEECIINSIVEENKLILGDMPYDALIFPNIDQITIEMANKLKSLVKSGLLILFLKQLPDKQPGYLNFEENDKKIKQIILDFIKKNQAYFIEDVDNLSDYLLNKFNINPGVKFDEIQPNIYYIHKKTDKSDYYFIRHSTNQPKQVKIKFFHPDKVPFILDPWTGEINQAIKYYKNQLFITLELYFEPYDSKILEFKEAEEQGHIKGGPIKCERIHNEIVGLVKNESISQIILKKWHFKTNIRNYLGDLNPIEFDLEELKDWREISALKYCSSRGIYSSEFNLSADYIKDDLRLILSIERVHDAAVIIINGIKLSPLLVYPYEIDITQYIEEGKNDIIIEITPTLRNRLIGYGKKGGKNWKNHKRKKEFMPSGLIGPIVITAFIQEKLR